MVAELRFRLVKSAWQLLTYSPAPCGRGLGGGVSRRQARMILAARSEKCAAILVGALPRADPSPYPRPQGAGESVMGVPQPGISGGSRCRAWDERGRAGRA